MLAATTAPSPISPWRISADRISSTAFVTDRLVFQIAEIGQESDGLSRSPDTKIRTRHRPYMPATPSVQYWKMKSLIFTMLSRPMRT